jgi:hypothetical protein
MDGTADGTSMSVALHHHIAANTDLQSFCGTDVATGHHNLANPADIGRSPGKLGQHVQAGRRSG